MISSTKSTARWTQKQKVITLLQTIIVVNKIDIQQERKTPLTVKITS